MSFKEKIKALIKYKNYSVTLLVEFSIVLLSFLIFRIASEQMEDIGFSEYNLARRSISFIQPLLMIGLGVAVPRYIGIYNRRNSILRASLLLLIASASIFFFFLFVFQSSFANLFFGDISYENYLLPIGLLLIGYCFHSILFGFLRGKQNVYFSNAIQLINIGILPIAVLLYTSDILKLLYINSSLILLNCSIITILLYKKYPSTYNYNKLLVDFKTLLRYGLPRVLGDFSLLALLTLPTYIILYTQDDILISGDVAYCITLLNIIGAAFGPLGLVMLPEISSFIASKNHAMIRRRFLVFLILSLSISILGYMVYFLFSDFILTILLGKNYRVSIQNLSLILLLGSFGYSLYIVLRSFLDAIRVRATNSINLIISLFVYGLLVLNNYRVNGSVEDYLYSFVWSISLLGVLTLIQTIKAIKEI